MRPEYPVGELDRQSGTLRKAVVGLDVAGIKAKNKTYGKRPEALSGIWERGRRRRVPLLPDLPLPGQGSGVRAAPP